MWLDWKINEIWMLKGHAQPDRLINKLSSV